MRAKKLGEKDQILHGDETGYEQNFYGPTINVDARSVSLANLHANYILDHDAHRHIIDVYSV